MTNQQQYYSLAEVSQLLDKRPYQVIYPITTRQVEGPERMVAGRRLFTEADIERLKAYFDMTNAKKGAK